MLSSRRLTPKWLLGRSMSVDRSSPPAPESSMGMIPITGTHQAGSCVQLQRHEVSSRVCSAPRRSIGRQVQIGRQGLGFVSSYLVHAIDPMLAPLGQNLEAIGRTGYMVIRLLMCLSGAWKLTGLQRALRQNRPKRHRVYWEQLLFTLRRSRGATGRHQKKNRWAEAAFGTRMVERSSVRTPPAHTMQARPVDSQAGGLTYGRGDVPRLALLG